MTATPEPQLVVALVLGLEVGQAGVLAVLLVLLADKILGGNMKIGQQKKELCLFLVEMATISQLIVARSLVGKRIGVARQNNRRQYESPAAEMAALFNRGGSSSSHSFNRGVNYTRRARGM